MRIPGPERTQVYKRITSFLAHPRESEGVSVVSGKFDTSEEGVIYPEYHTYQENKSRESYESKSGSIILRLAVEENKNIFVTLSLKTRDVTLVTSDRLCPILRI